MTIGTDLGGRLAFEAGLEIVGYDFDAILQILGVRKLRLQSPQGSGTALNCNVFKRLLHYKATLFLSLCYSGPVQSLHRSRGCQVTINPWKMDCYRIFEGLNLLLIKQRGRENIFKFKFIRCLYSLAVDVFCALFCSPNILSDTEIRNERSPRWTLRNQMANFGLWKTAENDFGLKILAQSLSGSMRSIKL